MSSGFWLYFISTYFVTHIALGCFLVIGFFILMMAIATWFEYHCELSIGIKNAFILGTGLLLCGSLIFVIPEKSACATYGLAALYTEHSAQEIETNVALSHIKDYFEASLYY